MQCLLPIVLMVGCGFQLAGTAAFAQDSQPPAETVPQGQSTDQTPSATSSTELSDEVIKDVLSDFQRGFETHNLEKVLSVFDSEDMRDWGQFRDEMASYFLLHESFKMRYQLLQVNADKDVGTATADIEMDEDPLDTLPTPKRRSTQMRFQIKRTPKGWRIIGLRPMEFFGI
jgi:hypothetical protein